MMAPILYCRCSNCVCKATVLLTDTIRMNGISETKEDVNDVEKVSVMIEDYVEHNESRKENANRDARPKRPSQLRHSSPIKVLQVWIF